MALSRVYQSIAPKTTVPETRRVFLVRAGCALGGMTAAATFARAAQPLAPLEVAYAGSMGSLLDGPLKAAAASTLHLDLRGRGQGASALAQLIAGGSITPDIFLPITATPAETVFHAGKAVSAHAVARTEMVIAYSPKSRYATQLRAAAEGQADWWRVLAEPGFRFGRSDPAADPQGRNIIFTMMLAAKLYKQPSLVTKLLGPTINPQQINMEGSLQARMQSGELDAASAYRIQPGPFNLPYITLPSDINLSGEDVHARNPEISLSIAGKTYVPEPLIYYALALKEAKNPSGAAAFLTWLKEPEAQELFRRFHYDAVGTAADLHA